MLLPCSPPFSRNLEAFSSSRLRFAAVFGRFSVDTAFLFFSPVDLDSTFSCACNLFQLLDNSGAISLFYGGHLAL
jgi:hypothetical protein